MSLKVTILGAGSSFGTPAAGGFWGVCDPKDPRNLRTRASILVQSATTNIVVDGTYDLREQLNRVELQTLDGMLLSHSHSDHINGLDDLRAIAFHAKKPVDIYGNRQTLDEVKRRWPYIFKSEHAAYYTEFGNECEIGGYDAFRIGDIGVQTFEQDHTVMTSLGFRFGDFAYSVDVADLHPRALQALHGIDTWVVDGGSYHKDKVMTHANFQRVYEWVAQIKPRMTYITVLGTAMDYKTMCDELPHNIRPAYDGLEFDIP